MDKQFTQAIWNEEVEKAAKKLVRMALDEDLLGAKTCDITTIALVPENSSAKARIVAREGGIVCGIEVATIVREIGDGRFEIKVSKIDGTKIKSGEECATLSGNARDILTLERTILNFMGRLSGIATLTNRYVQLTKHTSAAICDTRKTTPGWRFLEKYAVKCGGGLNHRMGLHDAILIKDNHLAFRKSNKKEANDDQLASSIQAARDFLSERESNTIIEVEVDTLVQFEKIAVANPDIILLDNMSPATLAEAVAMKQENQWSFQLEASGGVNIETVKEIAETGVERISVGALTHSARNFDFGLDWVNE